MENPKVSIIIPIYGVEKYIERCARSLFEQTLDDIEYLFIDDCSPDKSIEVLGKVLEKYPERKSQVIIHRMAVNSGQAAVRKWGIENATGEYVVHCDSDDWVEHEMYEQMYGFAKKNDFDIVRCDFIREFKDYNRRNIPIPEIVYFDNIALLSRMLLGDELTPLWDKLIRRQIVQDNRIIFPKNDMQEDHVLTMQYFYYSSSVGYINKAYYHYCYNPTSITHQLSADKTVAVMEQVYTNTLIIQDFLENKGLANKLEAELIVQKYNCRNHILDLIKEKKYYQKWRSIFPEIDSKILLKSRIPIKVKIDYILIRIGLFWPVHKAFKLIKNL